MRPHRGGARRERGAATPRLASRMARESEETRRRLETRETLRVHTREIEKRAGQKRARVRQKRRSARRDRRRRAGLHSPARARALRFASLRDGKQPRNPGPRSRLDRTGVTFFGPQTDEQTRSRPSRRSVGRSRLEPLASGTRLTAGEPVVLGSRSRPRLTHARRDDARRWTRAPRSRAPGAARGRQRERGKPTPRTRRRKSRRTGLVFDRPLRARSRTRGRRARGA